MRPQTKIPPSPPTKPKSGAGRFGLVVVGVLLLLAGLLVVGTLPRLQRQRELTATQDQTKDEAVAVSVVRPHQPAAAATLSLPGNIQALQEATIYARTSGYLNRRLVDIGDRVKAGQLLALIDTPEVDQQLDAARAALGQAQADLEQARTNQQLAALTLERWQTLRNQGAVSAQDSDERRSTYDARRSGTAAQAANVRVREADVRRLIKLRDFKRVVAPFAGIVTARNISTGDLIDAGSDSRTYLFKVAQVSTLRIFVNVPQTYATAVRVGQNARVRVQELPRRVFIGRIARTAGSLDPAARTLLSEIRVDNRDGALLPGMYAQVQLSEKPPAPPLLISANALVFRSEGPQVAVVDKQDRVRYRKVSVGRDFGSETEITAGLVGNERLATNLTDDVREGARVRPIFSPPVQRP